MTWRVGDKAKWLGRIVYPQGASWNPPPPGWKPPTKEEREATARLCRNRHVMVLEITDGRPTLVLDEIDGFKFDPSIDISRLKPANYPGWVRYHKDGKTPRF